jgi:prepilin-type N-terminal cleavage/methylation domain-containing protein
MTRTSQKGFTLVELMISLVLFSVAIAGVLSVAVTMTQGFREQRQVIATESSVRAPLEFIADAIRNASPAVPSGDIQDVKNCVTGAIAVVNNTNAPDQLDIVYASGSVVTSLRTIYDSTTNLAITVTDASQLAVGDTLLITNMTKGHLVDVTAVNTATGVLALTAPGCTPALPVGGYPPGSLVIRALRARFTVDVTGAATDGVPTLMMDPDADGPASAEPLAENVEDMQIAVGVDVDLNKGIDAGEWEYSSGVGALAGAIRAMRITLVARAPNQLQGGTASFYRPAAEDRPIASTADSYRRRVLSTTVEIRNLGGSP